MTIKEIRTALIGKHISRYCGWNGSRENFTIGKVENSGKCIRVFPDNPNYGGFGVWVLKEKIPTLLSAGKIEESNTIDHCYFKETLSIS